MVSIFGRDRGGGIKGRAPDEGLSFTARVDLETGAVSDVVVTIE